MARRDRGQSGAASSPLVELESELRTLDRKRQAILRAEGERGRRFEAPNTIAPGSWGELESAVSHEHAT